MRDPSTRQNAFQQTADEFKVSVNAFRVAAVREGLTEDDQSLKFALPAAYEKALVSVCILYARQGTPLTNADFASLTSKVAGRDEDHVFSYGFVD